MTENYSNCIVFDTDSMTEEQVKEDGLLAFTPIVYIDKSKIDGNIVKMAGWIKVHHDVIPAYVGGVLNTVKEIVAASISIQKQAHSPTDFGLKAI